MHVTLEYNSVISPKLPATQLFEQQRVRLWLVMTHIVKSHRWHHWTRPDDWLYGLGPDSIQRWHLTSIGNPIVKIRRSYDRLISTMGFPVLVRWHIYIESGPWKRSPMQVRDGRIPGTIFQMAIWASEILKNIKLELHLELVYCSRSTIHFISLA